MMSKSKNGGDSWGTLHGRPTPVWRGWCFAMIGMKKLQAISDEDMHYHPMVIHVFYLPVIFFGWLCYSRCHRVQFNI